MAIGAMTIVDRIDYGKGEKNFKCTFDGDGNYPTGGTAGADVLTELKDAIAAAAAAAGDANVRGPEDVTIKEIIGGDCGQYEPYWAAGKLKVLDGGHATRDEVANGTNLSGTSFAVTFICD